MPQMSRNIHTFLGCDSEYTQSDIVIFGAPFDSTTSYRPGTRFASAAMRGESFGIETYSPYSDQDLGDYHVFDYGDLELIFGNTPKALDAIEAFATQVIGDNKIPLMIGGEHLVTLGAVRAAYKKYPDLHIIHFDAHADLREDYLGEPLSHASVMRRCYDILGDNRIFQFGIRSGIRDEFYWAKGHVFVNKYNFNGLENVITQIGDMPVYFTLDLDVLDPSCFPGTGTPEAGGVDFLTLLSALQKVTTLNIVGCDINELSPIYDQSGASTALACKLLRELLINISKEHKP